MSDAKSKVKRWFIHYQIEPIIISADSIRKDYELLDVVRDPRNKYIEVMPVEDHDRTVAELKAQLKEANEVAKFYADAYIYDAYDNDGCGDISKATDDYGTKARAYLEKWKGDKP